MMVFIYIITGQAVLTDYTQGKITKGEICHLVIYKREKNN